MLTIIGLALLIGGIYSLIVSASYAGVGMIFIGTAITLACLLSKRG